MSQINIKIINEINKLQVREEVKEFLIDMLSEEHAETIPHAYKEVYKQRITKLLRKNNDN